MSEEYQVKAPTYPPKQETCAAPFHIGSPKKMQKVTRRRFLVAMSGIGATLYAVGISAGCGGSSPNTPHLLHRFQDTKRVTSIAWSPDGTRIVSGSFDYTAKIWHVATEKTFVPLPCEAEVTSVAWSPDGTRIASGQWGQTGAHVVKIWESATGKLLTSYLGPRAANSVAWSYDNTCLAVGYAGRPSVDRMVKIWETMTGKNVVTYNNDNKNVLVVAWSPHDPHFVASGTDAKKVYIQRIDKNAQSSTTVLIYSGHGDSVQTLVWSPQTVTSGHYIASGSGNYDVSATPPVEPVGDTTVQVWDILTGKISFLYKGHLKTVTALAWSPDGKYIASGSADATVQVWQPFNGQLVAKYTGHSSDVNAVTWSPDGKCIASGGADQEIHIWQL